MSDKRLVIAFVGATLLLRAGPTRAERAAPVPAEATSAALPAPVASAQQVDSELRRVEWEPLVASEARADPATISGSLAAEELARWNLGGSGDRAYLSNRPGFHPATRVIVEIPAPHSKDPPRHSVVVRQYLAAFRNRGYWPYRLCFEASARAVASSGGDAWIRIRTDGRGRVVEARLLKSGLDRPEIAVCVRNATRSLNLHRSNLPRAAFILRVRLFPGDAPLPPPPVAEPSDSTSKTMHRALLDKIRAPVERCLSDGLKRDASLWGRLALRIEIDENGAAASAVENGSHFPDRAVVECSLSAARQARVVAREPHTIQLAARLGSLPALVAERVADPSQPAAATASPTSR